MSDLSEKPLTILKHIRSDIKRLCSRDFNFNLMRRQILESRQSFCVQVLDNTKPVKHVL